MGAGHGGHHPAGHGVGVHAELGVNRAHHHVQAAQHLVGQVERAVGQDVHLHAGEYPERGQLLVQAGDLVELEGEAALVEAVGHGEAGRVVGHGQPLVAQGHGRGGHLPQRGPAVGPGGVAVAVAPQPLQDRPALSDRHPAPGLQVGQVAVGFAGDGLGDDPGGAGADAVQLGEGAGLGPPGDLVGGAVGHRLGGLLEGLDLGAGGQLPVQVVDGQTQRGDRVHHRGSVAGRFHRGGRAEVDSGVSSGGRFRHGARVLFVPGQRPRLALVFAEVPAAGATLPMPSSGQARSLTPCGAASDSRF